MQTEVADPVTAILPLAYYRDVLEYLVGRGDVEFITYDDLDWGDDFDYVNAYPQEWQRWRTSIKEKTRDPEKIYLLIQHDSDSGPLATVEMAELECEFGARSSLMLFARWAGANEVGDVVSYPINWQRVNRLRERGFVVGLHANALHNARFVEADVYSEFARDYQILSSQVGPLRFFSPHGGRLSADKKGNASFDYMQNTDLGIRWVHNRYSARFNGYYSDGGLIARLLKDDPLTNLGEWVRGLKRGFRYRALVHSQYYSQRRWRCDQRVSAKWYRSAVQNATNTGSIST